MTNPVVYFAYIDEPVPFDPLVHARNDEDILRMSRILSENNFPSVTVRIKKPSHELLAPGQLRWVWLSYLKEDGTVEPLIIAWLIGLPEDMIGFVVDITLNTRPIDYYDQQVALAATLKVHPYWAPEFVLPEARSDPNVVLHARNAYWHVGHLDLLVTISDINVGEDGHIDFDSGEQVPFESVTRQFRNIPVERVKVLAEAYWTQFAKGWIDVTQQVLDAAKLSGSDDGVVMSYTGQGLIDDWPEDDDRIGDAWRIHDAWAIYLSQSPKTVKLTELKVTWSFKGHPNDPVLAYLRSLDTVPGDAEFYVWSIAPYVAVKYEVERRRAEFMEINLVGDIQPVIAQQGTQEVLEVPLTAPDLAEPVDPGDLMPIRDYRTSFYFTTERGKPSIEHLIVLGCSRIIERARCVEVRFKVPFEAGMNVTCRHTAGLVNDFRFPGGVSGKVVGTELIADMSTGEYSCLIVIACSIGNGNIVTTNPGEPSYIEDDYIEEGFYLRIGQSYSTLEGDIVYDEFSPVETDDDGVNFFDMTAIDNVVSCELVNGVDVQENVLDNGGEVFEDIDVAVDALNEFASEFRLVMKPLRGSFQTKFVLNPSMLMVKKTIDLSAAGL